MLLDGIFEMEMMTDKGRDHPVVLLSLVLGCLVLRMTVPVTLGSGIVFVLNMAFKATSATLDHNLTTTSTYSMCVAVNIADSFNKI